MLACLPTAAVTSLIAFGVIQATLAAPAVVRALVAAGADVLSIGESRHSLEDVYLEWIGEDAEAHRRRQ